MDASSSLTGALDLLQHDRGPAPSARCDDAAMDKVADDPVARRPVLSVVVVVGTKLPGAERGPAALGAKAHRRRPAGPSDGFHPPPRAVMISMLSAIRKFTTCPSYS